jgi:hypothetical protein
MNGETRQRSFAGSSGRKRWRFPRQDLRCEMKLTALSRLRPLGCHGRGLFQRIRKMPSAVRAKIADSASRVLVSHVFTLALEPFNAKAGAGQAARGGRMGEQ